MEFTRHSSSPILLKRDWALNDKNWPEGGANSNVALSSLTFSFSSLHREFEDWFPEYTVLWVICTKDEVDNLCWTYPKWRTFLLKEDRDGFRAVLYKQPISSEKSDFPLLAERAQFRDFSLAVFLLLRCEVFPFTNFGNFFNFLQLFKAVIFSAASRNCTRSFNFPVPGAILVTCRPKDEHALS